MLPLSGLRVAVFEGRRASRMAELVARQGGEAVVAPATRVVPLDPGPDAVELAARLRDGRLDAMLFLTDTGVRLLPEVMAPVIGRDALLSHLSALRLGARGPKTAGALRELGLPDAVVSEPPHTWRSLVTSFDGAFSLAGRAVAVQESGRVHARLRAMLMELGAEVIEVAVYRWALPEDTAPLAAAAEGLAQGTIRVALFTNGAQIDHLLSLAAELGFDDPLRRALRGAVVGAVGPHCASRLAVFGIEAGIVADPPRMERLVEETAARARDMLGRT